MWRFFYFAIFFAVVAGASCDGCGGESEPVETDLPAPSTIIGRWEITGATRNGKVTETLSGGYFEFLPDGRMFTNLMPATGADLQYVLEGNVIQQQSTPPVEYLIESVTDSTLVLSAELRGGMPFVFMLQRTPDPGAVPASPEPQ